MKEKKNVTPDFVGIFSQTCGSKKNAPEMFSKSLTDTPQLRCILLR